MVTYRVSAGQKISARKEPKVGSLDKIGEIGSGVEFEAEIVSTSPSETWVKILSGEYANGYGAVVYNNQSFAELLSEEPLPEPPKVVYPPVSYMFDFNDPKTLTINSDIEFETISYNGKVLKDASEG